MKQLQPFLSTVALACLELHCPLIKGGGVDISGVSRTLSSRSKALATLLLTALFSCDAFRLAAGSLSRDPGFLTGLHPSEVASLSRSILSVCGEVNKSDGISSESESTICQRVFRCRGWS